ncbi:MATH domain-containing protein [Tripterygium wilfordii]|uniref:MATH domain-containing protein n=1 Tax=Tripterygium wilfordii TaxID=458696 RepID=A0A7J7CWX8_TRIWF|nr:TNF receptor-associated factor homolog 1a-like [Tripterygium wilfordii]XP_038720293.1 TNF receptor-associated factor homolog 1a-like [Tripterygium wilfordii]XP_038720302.1 TNF receptor-associated factor homolog 1a-like [Tripterygium wilfordii]XP_038720303.1 TNF receptor-associated factor homolog 1a-like [Tripterygium wilfordii]KAF5738580.1 MATH domain-containing protein [Tripterygium wilfordii]
MAGTASEESGLGSSMDGSSSAAEASGEWRCSEQVENGTPSTSPPYWDIDEDDDGPKPSELFERHTWEIKKFSQITKRELRSDVFEAGGYKWYILIYPQGCDVCNHLSLFLCVADHEKLLPGWSHFAQFTIAVVNKDPKKSKYSDTLHRFWKKEHDWGWKKFMELSKVLDGFIDADSLIIKAQVQVIREKADRPFRCLDCQYRRELVRVYLTNVEQICRRFLEEKRGKLARLIEDKARWSSFRAFWSAMDQNTQQRMSKEKRDAILKVVVKHFFIEKEVTSTLVMDSLYSGLKALEDQAKGKKGRAKLLDVEEMPAPIVCVDKDMFVLVDDVLLLLQRAALEPLPPKDEKGPQNRTKDGSSGDDFNKDFIEHDEKRLTELGRRTVEIFALIHIFSNKIEVAYQEAVALKRQEELIREEEASWLAESEQKSKRGALEKEKKLKKKQSKQKRNNRKGRDRGRESVVTQEKLLDELPSETRDSFVEDEPPVVEKPDVMEDISDVSDSVDGVAEVVPLDSEERDASLVSWDNDTSEVHHLTEAGSSEIDGLSSVPNGTDRRSSSAMDDSSSTCSTDSVPSVVMTGSYKGSSFSNYQNKKLRSREKSRQGKVTCDGVGWANGMDNRTTVPVVDAMDIRDASGNSKAGESESETPQSMQGQINCIEQSAFKKEEVVPPKKKLDSKDLDVERSNKEKAIASPPSPKSPPRNLPSGLPLKSGQNVMLKSEQKISAPVDPAPVKKVSLNSSPQSGKVSSLITLSQNSRMSKLEASNTIAEKPTEKPVPQQVPSMSRPSSARLTMVQTATGRLGPDLSPDTHSHGPQSYQNAIMSHPVGSGSAAFNHPSPTSSGITPSTAYSQSPSLLSAPMFVPQSSERVGLNSVQSGFSYGMGTVDVVQNGPQWLEGSQRDGNRILHHDPSPLLNGIQYLDLYKPVNVGSRKHFSPEFSASTSGCHTQGVVTDEFPHLDIINDLLDDEQGIKRDRTNTVFQSLCNGRLLNRQFSYPREVGESGDLGTSSSSGRIERSQSYQDDRFRRGYSPPSSHFDSMGDFFPRSNRSLPYANGHIDGLMPNHWQPTSYDLSLLGGTRNADGDGYPYYSSNLACGINGYTVYRPSNGH